MKTSCFRIMLKSTGCYWIMVDKAGNNSITVFFLGRLRLELFSVVGCVSFLKKLIPVSQFYFQNMFSIEECSCWVFMQFPL